MDLGARDALVVAVVPLHQRRLLARPRHPGRPGGTSRRRVRAGWSARGRNRFPPARGASAAAWRASLLGQRHVGAAGVAACAAPLRLAVAGQSDLLGDGHTLPILAVTADTQLVYDFAEGSRDMRDLLGGKGANVAEMTRVLGAERVPAGFTITTEACVAYMEADRTEPDGARGPGRRGAGAAGGAGRQDAGRRRGPAAGVGALGRARVDARHARHGPEPGPERHVGRGAGHGHRLRALRLGLLPPLRADVRQRLPRRQRRGDRGGDQEAQVRRRREAGHRAVGRRPQGAGRRLQGPLPRRDGRGLPPGPARAADPGDPGGVRLMGRGAGGELPAPERHPRLVGHGRERAADGVRQQGRLERLGRGLQPRRGDRRARAQRRLPGQRPGRGRGLRRAQHARHRRAGRRAARRARGADGDPEHAGEALRRHAGHRVHGGGGHAVHAPDAQRQAARAGRGAVRGRRGRGGPARPRPGAADRGRRVAGRAAAPDLRPRGRLRGADHRRGRLARRRQGRGRVHRRPRRSRPRRTGATWCWCGRSPRPTTWPASTPRRGS